ncbi:conserved lipothrixviral protein [Sulfolobus islandicus filamentous virus 2]|uniref:Conserved lipothrixviral protein n=1 Tax=Sulfolobus islandicus filamentous virus 2 TaxID=1902331 RepID=A0A1D8BJB7_SIFV|nr:conserved lipothrixviral protein [Sulfolobus islandicus filamentous virus 2]
MIIHSVTVVDGNGNVLVKREFSSSVERQTYADILVDVISYIEGRKVKHVEKEILKENPDLRTKLSSAREIEDKFVVAEMVI